MQKQESKPARLCILPAKLGRSAANQQSDDQKDAQAVFGKVLSERISGYLNAKKPGSSGLCAS